MERDNISFADALKLAADLVRITLEVKLGTSKEALVLSNKALSLESNGNWGKGNFRQPSGDASSCCSTGISRSNKARTRGACWSCGEVAHRFADCNFVCFTARSPTSLDSRATRPSCAIGSVFYSVLESHRPRRRHKRISS